MRRLAAVIAALAFAQAAAAEDIDEAYVKPGGGLLSELVARAGIGGVGKSYALVVGISEFESFADLPTGRDPLKMRDYLIDEAGFDHVHVLTGDKVTRARLEELMLDEFRPLIGPEDRFLFYWSGHGVTEGIGAGEAGFLPLADSDGERLSTMVAMTDVERWDRYLTANQTLYLLDSCFSGLAGAAPQSDLEELAREQLSGPARHMLTAGRGSEQTIAVDELGGSIFTHALLKGLRGAADARNGLGSDGLVSVAELHGYVQLEVARLRRLYNWRKSITPQFRDLAGSDGAFFFPVARLLPDPVLPGKKGGEVTPQGGEEGVDLAQVQFLLLRAGYDPGPDFGKMSEQTRLALLAFQSDNALAETGAPDATTVEALKLATSRPAPQEEPLYEPLAEAGAALPEEGASAAAAPQDAIRDCELCPELVRVAGGRITMGRDDGKPEQGPAVEVEIAPFAIATTETTRAHFDAYVAEYGLDFVSRKTEPDPTCYAWTDDARLRRSAYAYGQLSEGAPDEPVACVNIEDVQGYIDWLNEKVEGAPYRLPTEAEFELLLQAARLGMSLGAELGGGGCELWNGADAGSDFTWRDDSCADGHAGVAPVGSFGRSRVHDLYGNLWEWTSDCWTARHDEPDRVVTDGCETGVVRGASFDDPPENFLPWVRQPVPVKRRQTNIGFRVARDLE